MDVLDDPLPPLPLIPLAVRSPEATVVIVTWNNVTLLRSALDALLLQDLGANAFSTVVVDNASVDGTAVALAEDYPWCTVIRNPVNLGFAGGANSALRVVATPYVALLNDDATPEPSWLRELLTPLQKDPALAAASSRVLFRPKYLRLRVATEPFRPGPHDPRELGVRIDRVEVNGKDVTGGVLWERSTHTPAADGTWTRPDSEWFVPVPPDGPVQLQVTWSADRVKPVQMSWEHGDLRVSCGPETTRVQLVVDGPRIDVINSAGGVLLEDGHGADRGHQHPDTGQFLEAVPIMSACGNGMAVRTAAGAEVGWFDEAFFLYYEDTDLSWRLRNRGWGIDYAPGAVLRHSHAASSGTHSAVFRFHVDRNRLLMLTKLGDRSLATRQVLRYPLTTVSMSLRALVGLLLHRPGGMPREVLQVRLRVLVSYLRRAPRCLQKRAQERRHRLPGTLPLLTASEDWVNGAA
jgi:GT2 family glycosyltransferase